MFSNDISKAGLDQFSEAILALPKHQIPAAIRALSTRQDIGQELLSRVLSDLSSEDDPEEVFNRTLYNDDYERFERTPHFLNQFRGLPRDLNTLIDPICGRMAAKQVAYRESKEHLVRLHEDSVQLLDKTKELLSESDLSWIQPEIVLVYQEISAGDFWDENQNFKGVSDELEVIVHRLRTDLEYSWGYESCEYPEIILLGHSIVEQHPVFSPSSDPTISTLRLALIYDFKEHLFSEDRGDATEFVREFFKRFGWIGEYRWLISDFPICDLNRLVKEFSNSLDTLEAVSVAVILGTPFRLACRNMASTWKATDLEIPSSYK